MLIFPRSLATLASQANNKQHEGDAVTSSLVTRQPSDDTIR